MLTKTKFINTRQHKKSSIIVRNATRLMQVRNQEGWHQVTINTPSYIIALDSALEQYARSLSC